MDENQDKKTTPVDLTPVKFDPLIKTKKIAAAIIVTIMVVAMILVFASFHWLYIEYSRYAENKNALENTFEERRKEIINDIERHKQEREEN